MTSEEFWQEYLDSLSESDEHPESYNEFSFGDSAEMADELGTLVLQNIKTGTASLAWDYAQDDEPLPRAGDHSLILDGKGDPMCIIETTRVYIEPYNQVGEDQADAEGEGDRSLEYWRKAHWEYFSRRCEALGREPSEYMPVVCERFRVVWDNR